MAITKISPLVPVAPSGFSNCFQKKIISFDSHYYVAMRKIEATEEYTPHGADGKMDSKRYGNSSQVIPITSSKESFKSGSILWQRKHTWGCFPGQIQEWNGVHKKEEAMLRNGL